MKNTDIIQPLAMGSAIAADGDKEIPNQSEAGTNTSTINDGFLPLTSEPTSSGGRNPQRTNFNGMFYLATDQRFYLQNGGVITYDPNVVSQIGGYPRGAILCYITNNGFGFVESLIDDNAYNFIANPNYINNQYWKYSSIANVQPAIENLNAQIGNIQTAFIESGLYVVFNKTTSGWYKAYYSDPEHTNRVWVMQGGTLSASSATRTVTFPLAFTASNSYVILKQFGYNNSGGTAAWWVGFWSCTATKAVTRTSGDVDRWFAIGW